jgi:hypothetical protein
MDEKIIKQLELNNEDIEFLNMRSAFYTFIGYDNIIEAVKKCIQESDVIAFANDRTVKFINAKNPDFTIVINKEKFLEKYPQLESIRTPDDEIKWINEGLHRELFYHIGTLIIDNLPKFRDHYILLRENQRLVDSLTVTSTIYGTVIDLVNYKVFIKYLF